MVSRTVILLVFVGAVGCASGPGGLPDGAAPTRASDRDRDGVADVEDFCAGAPEDRDGCDDEDGCPDPDDDGDGVGDSLDRCPYVAESDDGQSDEDGCPEPDDALVISTDRCWLIWDSLYFPNRSSALVGHQAPALESLATFLRACPEHLVIEIAGHRNDDEQSVVSAERAEAVRRELVDRGVPTRRLRTVSLGAGRPADPRRDEAARAKNRRVEFRVVRSMTCPGRNGDRPRAIESTSRRRRAGPES